jgi:hypothetical protein
MYEMITASYNEANARSNQTNKDKLFKYALKDAHFCVVETGMCKDVSRRYDPCFDDNYVSFTDIKTGKRYCRSQFDVDIEEVDTEG